MVGNKHVNSRLWLGSYLRTQLEGISTDPKVTRVADLGK